TLFMLATLSATALSHVLYAPMPDVATPSVENTCDTFPPSLTADRGAQQRVLVVQRLDDELLAELVLLLDEQLEVDVDVVAVEAGRGQRLLDRDRHRGRVATVERGAEAVLE